MATEQEVIPQGIQDEAEKYARFNVFERNGDLFSNNNDEAANTIKCSVESYIAGAFSKETSNDHIKALEIIWDVSKFILDKYPGIRDNTLSLDAKWTDEDMVKFIKYVLKGDWFLSERTPEELFEQWKIFKNG